MKLVKSIYRIAGLFVGVLLISSCSNYDPVPVSKCAEVVSHAAKVLGDFAPSHSEMMEECKKATDKERGCVMAATKKGKIAQCW
ncbi:MAG: hypothetical protein COA42_13700 [Alteromonadaceae bacterium]|nr:MAG: hypothetical protein COA42_13700 [Alteromonadaceae bacterium]